MTEVVGLKVVFGWSRRFWDDLLTVHRSDVYPEKAGDENDHYDDTDNVEDVHDSSPGWTCQILKSS